MIKHQHKELEEALENHRQAIADICKELGLYGATSPSRKGHDRYNIVVVNLQPASVKECIQALLRHFGLKVEKGKARIAWRNDEKANGGKK